jgi:hypothetical protein
MQVHHETFSSPHECSHIASHHHSTTFGYRVGLIPRNRRLIHHRQLPSTTARAMVQVTSSQYHPVSEPKLGDSEKGIRADRTGVARTASSWTPSLIPRTNNISKHLLVRNCSCHKLHVRSQTQAKETRPTTAPGLNPFVSLLRWERVLECGCFLATCWPTGQMVVCVFCSAEDSINSLIIRQPCKASCWAVKLI